MNKPENETFPEIWVWLDVFVIQLNNNSLLSEFLKDIGLLEEKSRLKPLGKRPASAKRKAPRESSSVPQRKSSRLSGDAAPTDSLSNSHGDTTNADTNTDSTTQPRRVVRPVVRTFDDDGNGVDEEGRRVTLEVGSLGLCE
jgi:hypothetical protein